jgi:type IX secretion system PorP/SprF family membrane protein
MKLTKTLFLLFLLVASLEAGAQSQYLFTQYDMNPVFINPAQTGAYEGTYRVGGIYRAQWNAASSEYSPLTGYVDAPVLLIAKRHWLGVGLMYAHDNAGDHKLVTRLTAISGAFHYALDKRYRNVLTLGVQFGAGGRSLAISDDLSLPTEVKSGSKDAIARGKLAENNVNFTDFNMGLLFKSTIDKQSSLSLGLMLGHIAKAKYSLLKTPPADVLIPLYLSGTIGYNRKINNKVSIHPSMLIHKQTDAFTANPQVTMGYKMNKKGSTDPVTLKVGLGYRANGNAANVLLGADFKDIKVGIGYDLNTGALANAANNSLEIALQYVGKIYKKPNVKGVMVCPKY